MVVMEQKDGEARKKNLKKIIEGSYGGDYDKVSELTGKSVDTLRKYLQDRSKRTISARIARDIEKSLHLSQGYLDSQNYSEKNIYYVTVRVDDSETHDLIRWLYEHAPEVVDCSAVLGQFDIILKIEVPNFHYLEKFFSRLTHFPKVIRTQTFASVDSLRWQRQQDEYCKIKDPYAEKTFVDRYRNRRTRDLVKQINDLEKGKIVADERMHVKISLLEIMHSISKSFFAIRGYDENIERYNDYCEREETNISKGMISKRIFTFPRELYNDQEKLITFINQAKRVMHMGVEIRFLEEEKWVYRDNNSTVECFAVADKDFVYIRKDSGRKSVLQDSQEYIDLYMNLFYRNWEAGSNYERFVKKHLTD